MNTAKVRFLLGAVLGAASLYAQVVLNPTPSRVLGQDTLQAVSGAPNLVEGRELYGPRSVALDTSVSPPILYVADTENHRVLAWRNAAAFTRDAPMADAVIGQPDLRTTAPQGPNAGGAALRGGLFWPSAVAVDASGNLWVADCGNNRILRYPKPFDQPDGMKLPDRFIGQRDDHSGGANSDGISARTLWLRQGNNPAKVAMKFDGFGHLWVTDHFNHRVLRYNRLTLETGAAADLVLGQPNFTTNTPVSAGADRVRYFSTLNAPRGLAFDQSGRLYVPDNLDRVLVFVGPSFQNAMAATRVLGAISQGQPNPIGPTDWNMFRPSGVVIADNRVVVFDTGFNRLLVYDPYDQWPPETPTAVSPKPRTVIGQDIFGSSKPRAGRTGLSGPLDGVYFGSELYVADTNNNRIITLPQPFTNGATRVLGQLTLDYGGVNLVQGQEFHIFAGSFDDPFDSLILPNGSMVVDRKSNPPHLYVADTYNHRVMGFRDLRRARTGSKADLVIGQPDLLTSMPNYPNNDTEIRERDTLLLPTGVAVDGEGNLWVADTGNSRILRFPKPFENLPARGDLPDADLVIGQLDFFSRTVDASSRTMRAPYGLAFTTDGHLLVSDPAHNRVLLFRKPFSTGMSATAVIGQTDFTSTGASGSADRFRKPRLIATDTSDRLYVADAGNHRISIFSSVAMIEPGRPPSPVGVLTESLQGEGMETPQGVTVSPLTGEIWVTDSRYNRVIRYPKYEDLPLTGNLSTARYGARNPIAVALDAGDNMLVAEASNRISMYFPLAAGVNAANYISDRPLSPGMYVTLKPFGPTTFGDRTVVFNELPNPIPMAKELGDIQVLVNERPVPIHFVSPQQINFYMPMDMPTSGTVDILVVRASTGQILTAGSARMQPASPGLFTMNASGQGQVAAINVANGQPNSPDNPVTRGEYISLFGTGQGFVSGAPAEGDPVGGLLPTAVRPRVFIGHDYVADSDIQYSGMAPGLIGVWQINVRVPTAVAPVNPVILFVTYGDIHSVVAGATTSITVR